MEGLQRQAKRGEQNVALKWQPSLGTVPSTLSWTLCKATLSSAADESGASTGGLLFLKNKKTPPQSRIPAETKVEQLQEV